LNYLVHLFLADDTPPSLLGNLMGDFVKGRLDDAFPAAVRHGIELHRRVDAFAHDNSLYRRSKNRLDDHYGYFRGVLIDIFYDHFLARSWHRYHPLPLEEFADRIYRLLEEHFEMLPPGLQQVAPRMIEYNWLVSYREVETIDRVLGRISARLRRANPIGQGIAELHRNYAGLETDCDLFLADAQKFTNDWKKRGLRGDLPGNETGP
jgi:acyl carrier protein phosphodiesterase